MKKLSTKCLDKMIEFLQDNSDESCWEGDLPPSPEHQELLRALISEKEREEKSASLDRDMKFAIVSIFASFGVDASKVPEEGLHSQIQGILDITRGN